MRRVLLVALALLLIPALALAGKTVTSGKNTLKIKADFDPAVASKSKSKPRPTELTFDYFADTTDGSRLDDVRSVVVWAGGAKFRFKPFPACDETDALEQGDGVCPDGSLVGEGTGVAEVRPDPADPSKDTDLSVDVKVYNGALDTDKNGDPMDPRPGLLHLHRDRRHRGHDPVLGREARQAVGLPRPRRESDPGGAGLYEIKGIHLTIDRRSVRQDGKRIPFLGLPTRCDGKWIVTATNDSYEGEPATAKHKVRCTEP